MSDIDDSTLADTSDEFDPSGEDTVPEIKKSNKKGSSSRSHRRDSKQPSNAPERRSHRSRSGVEHREASDQDSDVAPIKKRSKKRRDTKSSSKGDHRESKDRSRSAHRHHEREPYSPSAPADPRSDGRYHLDPEDGVQLPQIDFYPSRDDRYANYSSDGRGQPSTGRFYANDPRSSGLSSGFGQLSMGSSADRRRQGQTIAQAGGSGGGSGISNQPTGRFAADGRGLVAQSGCYLCSCLRADCVCAGWN